MVAPTRTQKQPTAKKLVKRRVAKAKVVSKTVVSKKKPVGTVARKQRPSAARKSPKKPTLSLSLSLTPRMLNGLMVGAVMMILVGAGMWLSAWLNKPENLPIQKVDWRGEFKHLNQAELDTLITPYIATNLYLLDAEALEQRLEAHPWVRSVSLHKAWPEQLFINVEEQFPVAFWGDKQLLNEYGEVFEGDLPGKAEVFATIYSPTKSGRKMAGHYIKLMKMLDGLGLDIAELIEDESGSWRMKFRQGQEVILGRKEQEKRVKRFKVGYMQELRTKFADVRVIDLRYTNGFAVEWKQGSGHAGAAGNPGKMMPERFGS